MEHSFGMKGRWPLWLAFTGLVGAFCLQYYSVCGNLLKRWNSEDFEYCYLVPFLFLYSSYTNRSSLKRINAPAPVLGFLVLVFSGILYFAGNLGSIETLTYMAIWTVIVGLCLLLLGIGMTKALAFPFLILAFMVPLPPFLNRLFTFKLKLISSALSVKMMQAIGLSAYREGNVIDVGLTQLQVVDACSGLRYVYPMLLMGLLFAYFFHKKWWERVVIVLATIPVSIFSNALRIAITGYLSKKVSPEIADSFFHGFSGWLIFVVSIAFLAALSWLLKVVRSRPLPKLPKRIPEESRHIRPIDLTGVKVSYLWMASFLFVFFWGLNTALSSAQVTPHRKSFEEFPMMIGEWEGKRTYVRQEILEELWADDYVQITFANERTGDALVLFIPYYEYQGTRHTAHSPLSCLLGGGFAPRSSEIIERNWPQPFGQVKIAQVVLEKNRNLLLTNYWFQQRGRIIVSEYANKWYLFWDSLERRRTDGAMVRIEMLLRQEQDVEKAQAVLDGFTLAMIRILPEYVPN